MWILIYLKLPSWISEYVSLPYDGQGGSCSQACLGGEFVRVPAIGVHMTKRRWGSSIAEKMHELVNAFGVSDMEAGNWLVSKR